MISIRAAAVKEMPSWIESGMPSSYEGEPRAHVDCFLHLLKERGQRVKKSASIDVAELGSLIKIGEQQFLERLARFGFKKSEKNSSRVHDYDEIYGQAFLLQLSSLPYPEEMKWKSEITFASHWWDDLVDRPDGIRYKRLERFVLEPEYFTAEEPEFGLLWTLIESAPDPVNALRGFVRLTYGGLIQRAPTRAKQKKYLEEYMEYSLRGVDGSIRRLIKDTSPVLFWMTTKTIFELMLQPDLGARRDLAVLLDCLFGPAIYYHDAKEEAANGELKFDPQDLPTAKEQAALINAVSSILIHFELETAPLRVQQLRYTLHFIGNRIPGEVRAAYESHLSHWDVITKIIANHSNDYQVSNLVNLSREEVLKALRRSSRPTPSR